jgi:hypothetical protein
VCSKFTVLKTGLDCNGNLVWGTEAAVLMAAVTPKGERLVIVTEGNTILQLESPFKKAQTFKIELDSAVITAVDICWDFIAIASFDDSALSGTCFLLSRTLDVFGEELSIPSPITCLRFGFAGKDNVAASQSGSFMRWSVSRANGFEFDIDYLYFNDAPIDVIALEKECFVMLAKGELLFCINGIVKSTGMSSICGRGKAVAYVKDRDVRIFNVENLESCTEPITLVCDHPIHEITEIAVVTIRRTDDAIEFLEEFSCVARFEVGSVRACAVRERKSGGMKVALASGGSALTIVRFSLETKEFSVVASEVLGAPISVIGAYDRGFVIGLGNYWWILRASRG